MATKSQEILLKGNTTNASAVPSSLKVREIAINALDRSLFTNDGNSIVKLYTGTTKWFDVNGNANNALKADSVAWSGIKDKPTTFTPSAHTHTASEVSGLPTSLKNPYALTFGSKSYDGSAAATITASDLGALTAHQSIYALTLQVNGTSQGVYKPASAAKTINIAVPTKTSQITNDSGFITSAAIPTALKNPYAVEIKANGVSLGTYDGSAAATFNLSAANVGAANKVHTHTASEISGLPTALSAFTNDVGYITGITKSMVEGVLTGDITSHNHTFASLTSKPTTIAGYGITDALTTSNYNSYTPTLTGTGASGTWGISISGNAASATKLATARKIWGQSFDGNGDVSGNINLKVSKLFWHDDANNYYIGTSRTISSDASNIDYVGYSGHRFICVAGEVMRINSNGNTLISTTTDAGYKFAVNGSALVNTVRTQELRLGLTNPDSAHTQNKWYYATIGYEYEGASPSTLKPAIVFKSMYDTYSEGSGNELMRIRANGNILIGTTTDNGYKLQVNGSERVYGDLIVDGEVSALVA